MTTTDVPIRSVTQEEFVRDPGPTMQRALDEGPVVVTNDDGEPRMVICIPDADPDDQDESESERVGSETDVEGLHRRLKAMQERYEQLKAEIRRREAAGEIPPRLTAEERADWAYGNAVIENDAVTRDLAEKAVRNK